MKGLEIFFWAALLLCFYTYIGYGMFLWLLVRVKECFRKPVPRVLPDDLPPVTLLVAAYNEEAVVAEKMRNCLALDYPADKLTVMWVTDGSDDGTVARLSAYPGVVVHHRPERRGKAAAFNRGVPLVRTPLVVFTDANTMLNPEAIREIVRLFSDPSVGCVAGEKRVKEDGTGDAAGTEGVYWRYESALKSLDWRLYSTVGAAGELFAVRTELFEALPEDTLLDDFVLSMRIAAKGRRIAYCPEATATEGASADMREEGKRKVRIAAGGLQAVGRLRSLLNPFRHGILTFQYVSHRVLRWTLTPLALVLLLPLNLLLVALGAGTVYVVLLVLQALFWGAGLLGAWLSSHGVRNRLLYIPYYFLFMNLNVFRGAVYLARHRGTGLWEKARRAAPVGGKG